MTVCIEHLMYGYFKAGDEVCVKLGSKIRKGTIVSGPHLNEGFFHYFVMVKDNIREYKVSSMCISAYDLFEELVLYDIDLEDI